MTRECKLSYVLCICFALGETVVASKSIPPKPFNSLETIVYSLVTTPCCWRFWYPAYSADLSDKASRSLLVINPTAHRSAWVSIPNGLAVPPGCTMVIARSANQVVQVTMKWKTITRQESLLEKKRANALIRALLAQSMEQYFIDVENADTRLPPFKPVALCM